MTAHRITYEGPPSLAVRVATQLADSDGVELTSAGQAEHHAARAGTVLLTMTVEGTPEAVLAAVGRIEEGLSADATITVDGTDSDST